MDAGMAGGIVGSVGGILGGAVGTYFSLKNATRPRERALTIRLASLLSLWIAGMLAFGLLMPRPWNQAAIFMTFPFFFMIPRLTRWSTEARAADLADVERSS